MLPGIAAYDTYGGEKADYQPAEDPTTDRSADQEDEALADVSAMTRTAIRSYVTFTTNGTTCTVTDWDAVWGVGGTPPAVTRTALGKYTVTWPASVTDARGNAQSVNLRRGWGNMEIATNGWVVMATKAAPNVLTIVTASIASGGVDESAATPISVFVL